MKIGERIKELRNKKNWSQNELAIKIPIPQATLCDIENNKAQPTTEQVLKVINALETTLIEFFNTTDNHSYIHTGSGDLNGSIHNYYPREFVDKLIASKDEVIEVLKQTIELHKNR